MQMERVAIRMSRRIEVKFGCCPLQGIIHDILPGLIQQCFAIELSDWTPAQSDRL